MKNTIKYIVLFSSFCFGLSNTNVSAGATELGEFEAIFDAIEDPKVQTHIKKDPTYQFACITIGLETFVLSSETNIEFMFSQKHALQLRQKTSVDIQIDRIISFLNVILHISEESSHSELHQQCTETRERLCALQEKLK